MAVLTLGQRAQAAGRANRFHHIRLVLAGLVIVAHAPELIDGDRSREIFTQLFGTLSCGELAVDGFFLLSGYLITQSWMACPSAMPFLRNRVLRIYPGFVVASLASTFIAGGLATSWAPRPGDLPVWTVLRDLCVLRPPSAPGAFAGTPYPVVNGSLWTIALEFVCYLAVLILGVTGVVRRRRAMLAVALACAAVYVLQRCVPIALLDNWKMQGAVRVGFCFAAGTVFYTWRWVLPFDRRLALLALAGLLLGLQSTRWVQFAVVVCGGYLLFFCAFAGGQCPRARAADWPDISYGVYLYGWPVQKLIILWLPQVTPAALTVATLAVAGALGYTSWHLVEKPFMRMKARRATPVSAPPRPRPLEP